MHSYHHILVALALDLSDRILLERGSALAQQFSARLSVLHVVGYIPIDSGELLMSAPVDLTLQLERQSHQQLEALCAEFAILPEAVHTSTGPVTAQIRELAETLQIDLIVLGHQPRQGLAAWFNHTEENVVTRAHCDVLVVTVP